ncbi:MAG: hypothetical protein E7488_05780 [Ruminococcaceae bacterium]|nr:hypothetical protein [Oscillospiraceae bacterium]
MKKKLKKISLIFIAAVGVCFAALYLYSSDYYRADETAINTLEDTESVSVEITDNMAIFRPENIEAGLIFYPGGKVEYTAYAPLMHKLAENDIACVITKMPFNLAVMDINAADKAIERIANVDRWYIGGHSLGGSMAANYLEKSESNFDGLVMLAAYSTADLSDNEVKTLCIHGSEDKVLNWDKHTEYMENLPEKAKCCVIEGGNHAQFGSYGDQKGDGEATLTAEKQLEYTAEAIIEFILD